jgi:hypothetical protein
MMNGRRPPMGVRSRSDHEPTTSGSHRAMRPSPPMSSPTTIEEFEKSSASTGRYVETVVTPSASANVGTPRTTRIRHSPRRSERSAIAMN